MLVIGVVVGIIWTSVDAFGFSYSEDPNNPFVIKGSCTQKYPIVFFSITYCSIVALIIFVAVLNFFTRNIFYRSFSTRAQHVLVYIVTVLASLGMSIYYLFQFAQFDPNYSSTVLSLVTILLL